MFGFLNINKPKGITSFEVIRRLRKVIKIKQIGHSGTLDPIATGVLVIGIGKATKLFDYLREDKAYIATLKFGYKSETFDTESELKKVTDTHPTKESIIEELKSFEGETSQTPPKYSAISINGEKLYKLARAGKEIENIPTRQIHIKEIKLVDYFLERGEAKIFVECSKGTYIRSIINDLGERLGTGAVMSELERVKSGNFKIESAKELEEIYELEKVNKFLINPLDVLSYSHEQLTTEEMFKVRNGQSLSNRGYTEGETVLLVSDRDLVSIARVTENKIKVMKVF